ncbi:hypothetical protein C0Q70_08341 [Pomacea canaliculata]|uniref:Uncharacterized protein n=1 Tax=Pomacea canaliculata TaxID=400727 RepID=A0A2T7PHK8_POMCA|nr:hypothetical protein C0Q70_08341 [Pomacea canaliculata]
MTVIRPAAASVRGSGGRQGGASVYTNDAAFWSDPVSWNGQASQIHRQMNLSRSVTVAGFEGKHLVVVK